MASMFDDNYYIPPLHRHSSAFPEPRMASDEGLLAYGGDLSSHRLLTAYKKGIFPWYDQDDPILWWSPNPRLLLYPKNFYVRKSFRRVLRSGKFSVTFDHCFHEVIKNCANIHREGQEKSWIIPEIEEAYMRLHEEGFAHSVEVYKEDKLVGGLYGVSLGKAFFGESMFSLLPDASKIAFKALSDVLGSRGYDFIDCQMKTDHMLGLGAKIVPRDDFLDALEMSVEKLGDFGSWKHFSWHYKDDILSKIKD
ncbi:MAG: leucyl/phenylalanyl-tRNA--protein transferase [Epsilonproteobacteria bacterium]|nr:MAG: leucyl/phenylalanyl-tRNA--protein transferase [Campylobacterota bacterium]